MTETSKGGHHKEAEKEVVVTITEVLVFEEETEEVQLEEEEVNHTLLQDEEQEVEEVVTTTDQDLKKTMFSATIATSSGITMMNAEVEQQQKLESKQILPMKGRGNFLIKLKNGDHDYISNVYYVLAMKNNILSMGQLLEKGYDINMKDCYLTIKDNHGNLIALVRMSKNRMFALNIQHDAVKCLSAIIKDKDWPWHLRFGYLNFGSLKLLSRKNMAKGLPHIAHTNEVCESCILGKHRRTSFAKEVK
ncbi:uncharacterized protein LOC114263618 [Camellia sinensis]|uniref:uncharacterized protein LOC114263618 n=1 Tax=Camellia sinensis TaxID=4442 RepID=UPI001035C8E6|nr:uncharacterized protein LOC114263618 [Camellia sinensis]